MSRFKDFCGSDAEQFLEKAGLLFWYLCWQDFLWEGTNNWRSDSHSLRLHRQTNLHLLNPSPFNRILQCSICLHYFTVNSAESLRQLTQMWNHVEQSKEGSRNSKACGVFSCQAPTEWSSVGTSLKIPTDEDHESFEVGLDVWRPFTGQAFVFFNCLY